MGISDKLREQEKKRPLADTNEMEIEQAIRQTLMDIFNRNLKFISRTELDVDTIERQFVRDDKHCWFSFGSVDFPTGKVIVSDPFYYLYKWGEPPVIAPVLNIEIPKGSFHVEISVARNEFVGIRVCSARIKIKPTSAVRYELAVPTDDTAAMMCSDGALTGFPVECGMMCFCDVQVADEYREFMAKHNYTNAYDDYFKNILVRRSDEEDPEHKYDEDFAEWANPDSGNRMAIVHTGLGDGFYQVFWGYDKDGDICELTVPFIAPSLLD